MFDKICEAETSRSFEFKNPLRLVIKMLFWHTCSFCIHKQHCSSFASPELRCEVAYNLNNRFSYLKLQQQKSMQKYCSTLKCTWKEFDTNVENAAFENWAGLRAFYNVFKFYKY